MGELKIETDRIEDKILLSLIGSLDASNLQEAETAFESALENQRGSVVLNLYECEYVDPPAVQRLLALSGSLQESSRPFEVYARPMSLVAHRLKGFPLVVPVPDEIAERGEERLAARRSARLARWQREKPQPASTHTPGSAAFKAGSTGEAEEPSGVIPIDFLKVSSLAGKDERVVREIWRTYCRLLDQGVFEPAPDGSADAQLGLDSRRVAFELRLDPRVVRKVIESVSTHLAEIFGGDEV
jgi:anti-anti-sigma regulatory factor